MMCVVAAAAAAAAAVVNTCNFHVCSVLDGHLPELAHLRSAGAFTGAVVE